MRKNRQTGNIAKFALICFAAIQVAAAPGMTQITDSIPDVPQDARAPIDPLFHETASRGIYLTFTDRYEESLALFDSLVKEHPEHPAPYFFKAATYQNWMSTYRISRFQNELEENVKLAIEKGKELLKKNDKDPWLNFYMGAAYGYRGFNRFRKFNFIGAYKDSKRGIDNFKEALLKDSTLYDVYLGLGSYHYWRTAKSKFIRIIAFWMPDKRKLGLKQLQFSIDHGRYSPNEAAYVLVTAIYDYGHYDEALAVSDQIVKKRGSYGLTDLYLRGRLMVHFGEWAEVESMFRQILERIAGYKFPSVGYQVECKYWIARAMKEQRKIDEARDLARQALVQSKDRNEEAELDGHLEKFDEILDQLEELNEDLAESN